MIKTKKLNEIKNKIINKIVSIRNIEKTKSSFIFKGSIFKEFLKKPNMKLMTIVIGFFSFLFLSTLSVLPFEELKLVTELIFYQMLFIVPMISIHYSEYLSFKKNIIKNNEHLFEKLNSEKLNEIKKNLTEDFKEKEVKMLLEGNLNKKDLEEIFFVMSEVIGKEELFKIFKKLGFQETGENISEPYVLVSIINEAIKNIKNKEKEEKEDARDALLKENKKIFDSIVETKTNKIEYEIA